VFRLWHACFFMLGCIECGRLSCGMLGEVEGLLKRTEVFGASVSSDRKKITVCRKLPLS
jgi:hypothetical protein